MSSQFEVIDSWEGIVDVIDVNLQDVESGLGIQDNHSALETAYVADSTPGAFQVSHRSLALPSDLAPYDAAVIECTTAQNRPAATFGHGPRFPQCVSSNDAIAASRNEFLVRSAFGSFATTRQMHPERLVGTPAHVPYTAPGYDFLASAPPTETTPSHAHKILFRTNLAALPALRAHDLRTSPDGAVPGARSTGAAASAWMHANCRDHTSCSEQLRHPDTALIPFLGLSLDAELSNGNFQWLSQENNFFSPDVSIASVSAVAAPQGPQATYPSLVDYHFACSVFETAMHTPAFLALPRDILRDSFLKSARLNCDEFALFQGVVRWARYRVRRAGLNDGDPRLVRLELYDLLPLIRFRQMSSAELDALTAPRTSVAGAAGASLFTTEERLALRELKSAAEFTAHPYATAHPALFSERVHGALERSLKTAPAMNAAMLMGPALPAAALSAAGPAPLLMIAEASSATNSVPASSASATAFASAAVDQQMATHVLGVPAHTDYVAALASDGTSARAPVTAAARGLICAVEDSLSLERNAQFPEAMPATVPAPADARWIPAATRGARPFAGTPLEHFTGALPPRVALGALADSTPAPSTTSAPHAAPHCSVPPVPALDVLSVPAAISIAMLYASRRSATHVLMRYTRSAIPDDGLVYCSFLRTLYFCFQMHIMNLAVVAITIVFPILLVVRAHAGEPFSLADSWPIVVFLGVVVVSSVIYVCVNNFPDLALSATNYKLDAPAATLPQDALSRDAAHNFSWCCFGTRNRQRGTLGADSTRAERVWICQLNLELGIAHYISEVVEGICDDTAWCDIAWFFLSIFCIVAYLLMFFLVTVGAADISYTGLFIPAYIFFGLQCFFPCLFTGEDDDCCDDCFDRLCIRWFGPWLIYSQLLVFFILLNVRLEGNSELSALYVFSPFFLTALIAFVGFVWIRVKEGILGAILYTFVVGPFLLWILLLGLYANKAWDPTTKIFAPSLAVANIPLYIMLFCLLMAEIKMFCSLTDDSMALPEDLEIASIAHRDIDAVEHSPIDECEAV
jgi:hypothetical protein